MAARVRVGRGMGECAERAGFLPETSLGIVGVLAVAGDAAVLHFINPGEPSDAVGSRILGIAGLSAIGIGDVYRTVQRVIGGTGDLVLGVGMGDLIASSVINADGDAGVRTSGLKVVIQAVKGISRHEVSRVDYANTEPSVAQTQTIADTRPWLVAPTSSPSKSKMPYPY